MKIEIKKLFILNFKGIRNYETTFSNRTCLYGNNATGKTTIFDAFTWLLFGKNSLDQQQFEVKTLDENNRVIPKINHEVTGLIEIDGISKEFKRVLREKWVKKRGELETEFAGNTEDFFIDRIPMSKSDYQTAISQIISEDQFKLITNPLYFNSVMEWKERRKMLFKMAGDTSYSEIAERYPRLQEILAEVEKKSIEGYKKQLYVDRKAIREQLDQIAPRIDEQTRTMPEVPNVDKINNEILHYTQQLKVIDGNLDAIQKANRQKREAVQAKYDELNKLSSRRIELEQEAKNKALEGNSSAQGEITKQKLTIEDKKVKIESLKKKIENSEKDIEYLKEQNNKLRKQITELNDDNPDFSQVQELCPTCKRPFEIDDIEGKREAIKEAFNEEKVRKYNILRKKGIENTMEISRYREVIITWQEEINFLQSEIQQIENSIPEFVHDYKPQDFLDADVMAKIDSEIAVLREEIERPNPVENDINGLVERQEIQAKIDDLRDKLSVLKTIEDKRKRIKELETESKNLAEQLMAIEKKEYLAEMFENAFVSGIEEKINLMFKNVQFRMFKEQINGGKTEDCTLIVAGVPWTDLNSGGKIQAGMECINTIGKHFDYYAPIWVDNAESITQLPKTESQLIRLVVSENHQELTIETN